jgi:hypothetical protein
MLHAGAHEKSETASTKQFHFRACNVQLLVVWSFMFSDIILNHARFKSRSVAIGVPREFLQVSYCLLFLTLAGILAFPPMPWLRPRPYPDGFSFVQNPERVCAHLIGQYIPRRSVAGQP